MRSSFFGTGRRADLSSEKPTSPWCDRLPPRPARIRDLVLVDGRKWSWNLRL